MNSTCALIPALLLLLSYLPLAQSEQCPKACHDCCPSESSACSEKKSKYISPSTTVPLERGGQKSSPYADKGASRRY
ncbi:MAG: hypothetical protein O2830_06395 [Verrucomicrobia bacterium]|nr:hypothetical protein [Verrucomicrobiota bacterium]